MHPEAIQDSQYSVPYHHLPHEVGAEWRIFRYLPWGYEYLAMLETIASIVAGHAPQSVLDFGCGDGRLASELSQAGVPRVVGVDVSERAIDLARAIVREQGVEFYTSLDAVSDRRFDLAVAAEVLEHIPDDQVRDVLQSLGDCLTQDGVLVVSVPTTNIPLNSKHYRHYTLDTLKAQADGLFDVQHVQYLGKQGPVNWLTLRMLHNRFVIPNWRPWLRMTTRLYRRYAMHADAPTGVHLIAILSKSGPSRA